MDETYEIRVIGRVQSPLLDRHTAPLQAHEGAPPAWLVLFDWASAGLDGLAVGDDVLVLTWLHQADRTTLRVHPRGDLRNPERGVFGTRSPDRPNPIGIHRARILEIAPPSLQVSALEAIDGTPIVDIKVALDATDR